MKNIGPTFGNELDAAGLLGLPFSWGADGTFQFDERMTQPQIDAVNAVYAAHDPTQQLPATVDLWQQVSDLQSALISANVITAQVIDAARVQSGVMKP